MSDELVRYIIPDDIPEGWSVLRVLRQRLRLSRSLVTRLKQEGQILLDGQPVYVSRTVRPGEELRLLLREGTPYVEAEPIDLDVVYVDKDLLIINKPPNMLVHPVKKERTGTLMNAIAYHFPGPVRPLHRLDRDTSGLVAFGRNAFAHGQLVEQLDRGRLHRQYLALATGWLPDPLIEVSVPESDERWGTIEAPIGQVKGHRVKRRVGSGGQHAITHYRVVKRFKEATLLAVRLETGRTHQIRVHLSFLGHPLVGDQLYGDGSIDFPRQALHAHQLSLVHPTTREPMVVTAPLPADFEKLLEQFTPDE